MNNTETFEEIWAEIQGEGKTYEQAAEALDKEIEKREQLGEELYKKRDFKAFAVVNKEREAFTQAKYGLQNMAFLEELELLKEQGLEESELWKAARAKGVELRGKEKELTEEEKALEEARKREEERKLNIACAKLLGAALNSYFQDECLDVGSVFKDAKGHSPERISLVIANTILADVMKSQDDTAERYSPESREWAQNVKKNASLKSVLLQGEEGIESADPAQIETFAKELRTRDFSVSQAYEEKEMRQPQPFQINIAEVQEAERKASAVLTMNRSADGISSVDGRGTTEEEKTLLTAAAQVKYEAQAARTADTEAKSQGQEQKTKTTPTSEGFTQNTEEKTKSREDRTQQPLKNPQVGQRVTFRAQDGKGLELTGRVTAIDENKVTLQSGKMKISISLEKGELLKAAPLRPEQTKQYGIDQAKWLSGNSSQVLFAREKGTYDGPILGNTPTYAIQKTNDSTVILHRLKDYPDAERDKLLEAGKGLSIVRNETGIFVSPLDMEKVQEREREKTRPQKSRGSQSR